MYMLMLPIICNAVLKTICLLSAWMTECVRRQEALEVVIRRRKGDMFAIVPKTLRCRSPFDVPGLQTDITREEILEAIRESMERA